MGDFSYLDISPHKSMKPNKIKGSSDLAHYVAYYKLLKLISKMA
jgi:hypothetical protein